MDAFFHFLLGQMAVNAQISLDKMQRDREESERQFEDLKRRHQENMDDFDRKTGKLIDVEAEVIIGPTLTLTDKNPSHENTTANPNPH